MKKTKRAKPAVAIYSVATDAPLNADMLSIAAARSEDPNIVRLSDWLLTIQREMAIAKPRNDEARGFADKCRALWTDVAADVCSTPSTNEQLCEAVLHALELGLAFHAFQVTNGDVHAAIQIREALRDVGRKLAATIHGPAQKQKRRELWAKIQRRCSELVRAGVLKPKTLETLHQEFDVKTSTLEKNLRDSGHLPRVKRNSKP